MSTFSATFDQASSWLKQADSKVNPNKLNPQTNDGIATIDEIGQQLVDLQNQSGTSQSADVQQQGSFWQTIVTGNNGNGYYDLISQLDGAAGISQSDLATLAGLDGNPNDITATDFQKLLAQSGTAGSGQGTTTIDGQTGDYQPTNPINRGLNAGKKVADILKNNPTELANDDVQYTTPDEQTGKLSIDGALAYSREALKGLDKDGDGTVTTSEAGLLGSVIDSNGDGKISAAEYTAFTMYEDSNGTLDGKVTADEGNKALRNIIANPDQAKADIKKILDGNQLEARDAQLDQKLPKAPDPNPSPNPQDPQNIMAQLIPMMMMFFGTIMGALMGMLTGQNANTATTQPSA